MRKIFEKYKKISWKINKILGSLEQASEKFVGNSWLIFLQIEKFSVIRVLIYYNLKEIFKKYCKDIWKSFTESLEKIWENFIKSFENISVVCALVSNKIWNINMKDVIEEEYFYIVDFCSQKRALPHRTRILSRFNFSF